MARITVEDCIDKFPSRFELVLVASQRARKLHSGDEPTVEKDNDKNTVIALREIADSTLTVAEMKENLIQEFQKVTLSDEEEEIIELDTFDQQTRETKKIQSLGWKPKFSIRDGVLKTVQYLKENEWVFERRDSQ